MVVDADVVDPGVVQVLQQHHHRAVGLQHRPNQVFSDELRGRNQHHCVGIPHDPDEINFITAAETVLVEFPVPFFSRFISALHHRIKIVGRKIRTDHADPRRNPLEPVGDQITLLPDRAEDNSLIRQHLQRPDRRPVRNIQRPHQVTRHRQARFRLHRIHQGTNPHRSLVMFRLA
ncbi:hypothetical protein SDC9_172604 [bioreactor metagenome]|uniref:Uncharacterized protein n=1 Tax=bioreactor metagenome TaxID=1076179 RepID=A0A645GE60_9ZZZZ